MSLDRERCPECGMSIGRKTRMGDPLPLELSTAHRRILDLEQKNKALGLVNAAQAKRIVALTDTIHHHATRGRQRAG